MFKPNEGKIEPVTTNTRSMFEGAGKPIGSQPPRDMWEKVEAESRKVSSQFETKPKAKSPFDSAPKSFEEPKKSEEPKNKSNGMFGVLLSGSENKISMFTSNQTTQVTQDTTNIVSSFYKNHPLLAQKTESFMLMVQEIDEHIQLDSAVRILKFATDIQTRIGKFLEDSSAFGSTMVSIGLMEVVAQITDKMKSLDLSNFRGTKKTGIFSRESFTVNDFVVALNKVEKELNALMHELASRSDKVLNLMVKCESLIDVHEQLVDELDANVIAGKITLERNRRKMFKEHNEEFLIDKFDQRILELAKYEHMCVLSFEQVKLIQNNLMSMATNAQSMVTVTYPLWKTSFSTLISKWQSGGTITMSTPIDSLYSDPEFQNANKTTETIITTLNQKV